MLLVVLVIGTHLVEKLTELGMLTSVREVQKANALLLMEVTELGISISLAPAQALQLLQTVTAIVVLVNSINPQTCTTLFIITYF
jgi:hypothetical protein